MTNYTTITINDQRVGLKFGLPAIRLIVEKVSMGDSGSYTEMDIAHILWAGYLNDCAVKEKEVALSFEEINDHVEECFLSKDADELLNAITVFGNSRVVKELAARSKREPAPAAKEEKKNQ